MAFGSSTGKKNGFFGRLKKGLSKTHTGFVGKVEQLFSGKEVSGDLLDELEEILILSDLGVHTSTEIIGKVKDRFSKKELKDTNGVKEALREELEKILTENHKDFSLEDGVINIFFVLGVNGVGKTTTIGKLASHFSESGHKTILAAGDTFRAAAIEQLETWGNRVGIELIKHKSGSDPSAVVFDSVHASKARGADVLLIDTAGRLHTKKNLMEELKKMRRVTDKAVSQCGCEANLKNILVLDATIGQNAISQARVFHREVGVDGLIITKLDGTSKGGVVFSIVKELGIPVYFIGIGEGEDDLREFIPQDFVLALFSDGS